MNLAKILRAIFVSRLGIVGLMVALSAICGGKPAAAAQTHPFSQAGNNHNSSQIILAQDEGDEPSEDQEEAADGEGEGEGDDVEDSGEEDQ